jgi:hypothetical protein
MNDYSPWLDNRADEAPWISLRHLMIHVLSFPTENLLILAYDLGFNDEVMTPLLACCGGYT